MEYFTALDSNQHFADLFVMANIIYFFSCAVFKFAFIISIFELPNNASNIIIICL